MGNAQYALDEPRPGFARRAENFDRVIAEARSWKWQPGQTVGRVMDAVITGAFDLSMGDRALLALYASHLNQERLEQGDACVWPSTQLMCRRMGCGERTARMARARLEKLGYMVRDYNRLNRPAGEEAYDLRPLLARMEALERADDELRATFSAEREARYLKTAGLDDGIQSRKVYTAQAANSFLHEQSHQNLKNTVSGNAAASPPTQPVGAPYRRDMASSTPQIATDPSPGLEASAICSPEGASGFADAKIPPSPANGLAREELELAIQACPRLFSMLPSWVFGRPLEATRGRDELGDLALSLAALLPEPERNNERTIAWGWRNHGPRMLAMLAIALEDPNIRFPARYFGSMATRPSGDLDLRINLRRILAARGETAVDGEEAASPDPETPKHRYSSEGGPPKALTVPPGADDPVWLEIARRLQKIISVGAYGSWFSQVGFEGIRDGVLILTSQTNIAADRIKQDHLGALLRACTLAGVECDRIMISVRRSGPPA